MELTEMRTLKEFNALRAELNQKVFEGTIQQSEANRQIEAASGRIVRTMNDYTEYENELRAKGITDKQALFAASESVTEHSRHLQNLEASKRAEAYFASQKTNYENKKDFDFRPTVNP